MGCASLECRQCSFVDGLPKTSSSLGSNLSLTRLFLGVIRLVNTMNATQRFKGPTYLRLAHRRRAVPCRDFVDCDVVQNGNRTGRCNFVITLSTVTLPGFCENAGYSFSNAIPTSECARFTITSATNSGVAGNFFQGKVTEVVGMSMNWGAEGGRGSKCTCIL